MRKARWQLLLTVVLSVTLSILVTVSLAAADNDHTAFITGPLQSGPETTKQCLECHEKAARDFMKTVHWTWECGQDICLKQSISHGKKNALNNFCISVAGNEPRCTQCHAGYGWKDADFDFSDATKVDCLVCHDTTGTYTKAPTTAGLPADNVDLLFVAQNVGKPSRATCGACHFFGGGGDAVKHGDLDSSMEFPGREIDVHMDAEGNNFSCQKCHVTENHQIMGNAMVVSPAGQKHFTCDGCHSQTPHKESRLNQHVASLACQTCHVPFFAKEIPTKLSWDWSTAGQNLEAGKDQYGKPTYAKQKGSFVWGQRVQPVYAWFNGVADVYKVGDKIDPNQVTKLSYPVGSVNDAKAKIYPFKYHQGKQIYDTVNKIFITPKLFGKDGYWKTFDWDTAAAAGQKLSGQDYSGQYGFAPTVMYWRINHMVAPAKEALGCLDCHGDQGRLSWKELGYQGDPMTNPQWVRQK